MKKLLLTLGLATLTAASAVAEGTINPQNNIVFRFAVDEDNNGTPDRFATRDDGFELRMFYGAANSDAESLVMFPQFAIIGNTPGVFTGFTNPTHVPGTQGGDIISVQMRISNPSGWHAESQVIQVQLMPDLGPGQVIWGSAPGRIGRLTAVGGPNLIISSVPEPSTLALGGLAGAFLLFRLRKSNKQ